MEAGDAQLLEEQSVIDARLALAMQTEDPNHIAGLFAASIAVSAVPAPAVGHGGVGFRGAGVAGASDRVGGGFGTSAPAASVALAHAASAASAASAATSLATPVGPAVPPASNTSAGPPTPSGLPLPARLLRLTCCPHLHSHPETPTCFPHAHALSLCLCLSHTHPQTRTTRPDLSSFLSLFFLVFEHSRTCLNQAMG